MSVHDQDLLEELELWPQWHLRREPVAPEMQSGTIGLQLKEEAQAEIIATQPSATADAQLTQFRLLVNQDASMLIVCDPTLSPTMQALFNNLLKVIDFSIQQDIASADVSHLANYHGAVVLVMGESLGQAALKSTLEIDQLRQQVHAHESRKMVVTYAIADLVNHPENKAYCWQDLCLAQLTINHLKSQV